MTHDGDSPILKVEDLTTSFVLDGEWRSVVRHVGFEVRPRETVALVGESGSGKSVTALSIMRLLPEGASRIEGRILLDGRDVLSLSNAEMRQVRGNDCAMIFQEPMTSLNPVFTIGRQISEALIVHRGLGKDQARAETIRLLERVRIPNAASRFAEYPHQFSGGMRQRVMIAMALACHPKLLIADEPTTALDVTIQAQILDLMRELKSEIGAAIILITHDLGVVAEMAQRVVVMYAGRKVEEAAVGDLFRHPLHPYTKGLLNSVPRLGASLHADRAPRLAEIAGTVPSLREPIPGCPFATRCTLATAICEREMPVFEEKEPGHFAACFHSDQLAAA